MVLLLIEVLEVSELVDWFNICQDCPTKIITLEAIGSPQNSKFNVFCTILKLRCFLLTALHIRRPFKKLFQELRMSIYHEFGTFWLLSSINYSSFSPFIVAAEPIFVKWNQVNSMDTRPAQNQGQKSQHNTQEKSENVRMMLWFSFMSGGSEPVIICLCFFHIWTWDPEIDTPHYSGCDAGGSFWL